MTFNSTQFAAIVAQAKNSAANHPEWLRAIDRAAAESPAWIVTELHDHLLITSSSGETYRVSGHCTCKAGVLGRPCKHLAYRRLRELAQTETAPAVSTRADIISDIRSAWAARFPGESLADELMRRFKRNSLEMLSIDFLAAVRAAIA